MVTGIATVWCGVSDMARAIEFYRDVLGLTPNNVGEYWTDFDLGGLRLGLHLGSGGPGGFVAILITRDLQQVKQTALAWVSSDFHQTPGGVVLTLRDPDGNQIQVLQPGSRTEDFSS